MLAGSYVLVASCTDNDGLSASDSVTITVSETVTPPAPDPVPPQVSFAAPINNLVINAGEGFDVSLNASDSDGSISFCQLRINNAFVRQENVVPYEWGTVANDTVLQSMTEGNYTLQASCTDNDDLSTSATINVTVVPAPAAPSVSFTQASLAAN
jgi:hypothetical protein